MIRTPETEKEWEMYYDLRFRILRAPFGKERGSEKNEGDADAKHLAYFENEKMLGVARVDKLENAIFQVRFVAVEIHTQGKGIGKKIMQACEEYVKENNGAKIILHARDYALPFYKNQSYITVGASYKLFDILQHYEMYKDL